MHLLHTGRKLLLAPSVYDMYLRPKAQGRSCGVHSHVSAAHHSYLFSPHNGGVGLLVKSLHKIASGEIFIGRKDAVCLLSGNPHKLGKSCARTHKHCIKAFLCKKLVNGNGLADHHVCLYFYSKIFNIFNFPGNHPFFGQTEFRDTIDKYAAGLMKGFKNSNLIAKLCQIAGTGKTCRAGTDHRHLFAVLLLCSPGLYPVFTCPIRHKTFQLTDGNRFSLNPSDTFSLALALLGAYTPADCRQGGSFADHLIGRLHIPVFYLLYKAGNINGHRTALDTLGIFAVNAPCRFFHSFFFIVAKAYLIKIGCPNLCILFPYRNLFQYVH